MTTREERAASFARLIMFAETLLVPKLTPGVPRAIRREAGAALRHCPMLLDSALTDTKCNPLRTGRKAT
jgi:hypothetical protein